MDQHLKLLIPGSRLLNPGFGTFNRPEPLLHFGISSIPVDGGAEGFFFLPEIAQSLLVTPGSNSQTCQKSSTHGSGFKDLWTSHIQSKQIGLELTEELIGNRSAIDSQFIQGFRSILADAVKDLRLLKGDRLKRSPDDVTASGVTGQTDHQSPGIRVPMRGT